MLSVIIFLQQSNLLWVTKTRERKENILVPANDVWIFNFAACVNNEMERLFVTYTCDCVTLLRDVSLGFYIVIISKTLSLFFLFLVNICCVKFAQ